MIAVVLLHLGHVAGRTMDVNGAILSLAAVVLALITAAIWAPNDPRDRLRSLSARCLPSRRFSVHSARLGTEIATRVPRRRPLRLAGLLVILGVAVAFLAYLTAYVPIQIPVLPRSQSVRYWPAAVTAAALVIAVDTAVVALSVRAWRRLSEKPSTTLTTKRGASIFPPELQFQRVPPTVIRITAAASAVLLIGTTTAGVPLWCAALAALVPWLPVFAFEAIWKYEHYGLYAFFLVVTVLQVGHLGEHAAQVTQLLATHGDLSRSHGVFGRLDFETVHFFWDSGVWLSTGLLAYKFSRNRWLWVSFAVASVHEVEHVYLYWLVMIHKDFYMQGGLAGIIGRGGVIGSPLYRPYLHFMYNLLVVMPMLRALWDQTKVVVRKSHAEKRPHNQRERAFGLATVGEARWPRNRAD